MRGHTGVDGTDIPALSGAQTVVRWLTNSGRWLTRLDSRLWVKLCCSDTQQQQCIRRVLSQEPEHPCSPCNPPA